MKFSNFFAAVACFSCVNFSSVAVTITVTTTADSGPGSLRSALAGASFGDIIDFAVAGPAIVLTTGELFVNPGLTIQGPGAANLAISGNHSSRVFNIYGIVTISDLTIQDGFAPADFPGAPFDYMGGGIFANGSLTLNRCIVTGNSAGRPSHELNPHDSAFGGGIFATLLYLNDCTLSSNTVASFGSGLSQGGGLHAGTLYATRSTFDKNNTSTENFTSGGGVSAGTAFIVDCTISRNSAGSIFPDATSHGGGIFASTATMVNTTISGNSAIGDPLSFPGLPQGGGLSIVSNGDIKNSTITGNSPAGILNFGGSVSLQNTIVAGNFVDPDVVELFAGLFVSQGHNLIGANAGSAGFVDGVNGDQVGTVAVPIDAQLGPLQNNGGPTFTHSLLPGSTAINAGDNTGAPATDQRGFPRIVGGTIDIGAYELNSPCGNDAQAPSTSYTTVQAFQTLQNPLRRVGSFKLFASDDCDPDPLIYISDSATGFVAGPFHNGDKVEIGKGPALINSQHPPTDPSRSSNSAVIHLQGGARMYSVDSAGNTSPTIKVL